MDNVFHLNQVITQVYLLLCIENLTLVIHIISQGNISKALTPPCCTGVKKPAVNSVPGQFQPQNTVTTYYIQSSHCNHAFPLQQVEFTFFFFFFACTPVVFQEIRNFFVMLNLRKT